MAQMMAIRASRITSYQQSALLVGVLGVLTVWVPAPGVVPLMVGICFISPLFTFFNLYGQDGTYFTLWLAAGISLEEWTRARQLFSTCYLLLFSYAGLGVLAATGIMTADIVRLVAPIPVGCGALAVFVGPRVSRFVVTATENRDGQRHGGSARGMAAMVGASVCTGVVGGISVALATFAPWAPWIAVAFLCAFTWLMRTRSESWSPGFRLRLALSLRD